MKVPDALWTGVLHALAIELAVAVVGALLWALIAGGLP
jgi:hypothetical protein